MKEESNKLSEIQALRAIAIIAVVLIHTSPTADMAQIVIRPFINFSVALFLFLSGYLTKLEIADIKLFYKKRIFRVLIPYVIWTIIYDIINGSVKNVPRDLLTTEAAYPFYYIFVYIQFVLITPLLTRLVKSKHFYLGFIIAPISMLVFKYPSVFWGIEMNRLISLTWSLSCLSWFTFYYLGLLLGNRIIIIKYSIKNLTIFWIFSIILQMVEGYVWLCFGATNVGSQGKITSLITSCIFLLIIYRLLTEKQITTQNKLLLLVGDFSFGIYMIHALIIDKLSKYGIIYTHVPYIVNTLIIIFISSLVCYLGNSFFSRKINRWLGFS